MTTMQITQLKISLTVRGPFLTQSSAPLDYGIDAALARNKDNTPYLPGTLLTGKLREAWLELAELGDKKCQPNITGWLGDKSDPSHDPLLGSLENSVLPKPKRLYINDLLLTDTTEKKEVNYRIRLDSKRGSVEKGAYLVTERPFAPGDEITFQGTARFLARDETEANELTRQLKIGLKWLTQLGADRTVGFGELIGVHIEPDTATQSVQPTEPLPVSDTYDLMIHPESPFCISEHHIAGNNLFRSSSVIPGGVIKGTLARLWKTLLGRENTISVDSQLDSQRQELCDYFDDIRICHALPGYHPIRPVQPPLSLVKTDEFYDVALCDGAGLIKKQAPAFAVDWKGEDYGKVDELFGIPSLEREVRVRTKIDYQKRRSDDQQLFAYEMVVPNDEIGWYARLDLSAVPAEKRPQVVEQLQSLLTPGLVGLSKTKAYAQVELLPPNSILQCHASNLESRDGVWILTLQTPALLCNPDELMGTNNNPSETLHQAYASVFAELSDNSLELVRFFATQSLAGGFYLSKRFQAPNPYQPYLLTNKGSVFVLQPKQEAAAKSSAIPAHAFNWLDIRDLISAFRAIFQKNDRIAEWPNFRAGITAKSFIEKWSKTGLPLPKWANEKYRRDDKAGNHWSNCPYIPQNGYGEIAVNLPIHWDKYPKDQFIAIQ